MKSTTETELGGARRTLRFTIRYLSYPILMVLTLGASITLVDTSFPQWAIVPMVTLFASVYVAVLERVQPFYEGWNRSRKDVVSDATSSLVALLVVARLIEPLFLSVLFAGSVLLSEELDSTLWPTSWPPVAQAALALLVGEFFYYWMHRWIHGSRVFWRFHAVHHSSERLYWLNSARFHPIDFFLDDVAIVFPLALTGWTLHSLSGLIILLTFYNCHGVTMHSNMDVRLGPLNYLVPGPEGHRWHHSRDLREANKNFGGKVVLWDLLFGTFYLPADRMPPEDIGLADQVRLPDSYLGLLLAPFRWSKLPLRKTGAASGAVLVEEKAGSA
ncbi:MULTISPECIES: sterol desaturase family protein [unclassified Kitasatospora]|uniref:sterol desaturase family protein n=1 Tax=unclassified Kitasatospora TaxID=2633591 RepID=UPI0037FEB253